MNTCDLNHEKIVFEGSDCPLCEANDLIYELKIKLNVVSDDFDEFVHRLHTNKPLNLPSNVIQTLKTKEQL
jgi:hypothetical protein